MKQKYCMGEAYACMLMFHKRENHILGKGNNLHKCTVLLANLLCFPFHI